MQSRQKYTVKIKVCFRTNAYISPQSRSQPTVKILVSRYHNKVHEEWNWTPTKYIHVPWCINQQVPSTYHTRVCFRLSKGRRSERYTAADMESTACLRSKEKAAFAKAFRPLKIAVHCAEWRRRRPSSPCSRSSRCLRPWEDGEPFSRCSLSFLRPLRAQAWSPKPWS